MSALPEGTPPGAGFHEVTLIQKGVLGMVWSTRESGGSSGPRRKDVAVVVKAVKPGSPAAYAGVKPFEILIGINGESIAPLQFDSVIAKIKATRPLRLSFAPLEIAQMRAKVLWPVAGPLGLKLEPATGDPSGLGVRLKSVLPGSTHANTSELQIGGLELAAMRVGLDHVAVPLCTLSYRDAIAQLKGAGRPLTLYFEPGGVERQRVRPAAVAAAAPLLATVPAAARPPAAAPTSAGRREIEDLYGRYNPEKLTDVETLLTKYGEGKLLSMVRKKYREQIQSAATMAAAPEGAEPATPVVRSTIPT